jgi:hypothetical protein
MHREALERDYNHCKFLPELLIKVRDESQALCIELV